MTLVYNKIWKLRCDAVVDFEKSQGMKILMNTILSNWIFMNLGALKEGVNIWSVLRALRVLGGEGSGDDKKDKGVVLPALEEGANGKKLIVKADENTRKYLDQYEASRPRTVVCIKL
ncbi:hypothetical protein RhiirC2_720798 [Rhizophagus irregularis]|uniref:Uncharacterized protein n=1 Tax=Rhizophagus irregularis TaxID=588596 RepID=A0A2N1M8X4_9GLOM|nr:hypothetical protein RhiirC2_720798 [Rhizophagus irregularis]